MTHRVDLRELLDNRAMGYPVYMRIDTISLTFLEQFRESSAYNGVVDSSNHSINQSLERVLKLKFGETYGTNAE